MRKLLIASAVAAIAVSAPAYAQTPAKIFTAGVFSIPGSYPNATVFQNFESTPGTGAAYTPLANESVTPVVTSQSGDVPGTTNDPDNSPTNKYLAIGAPSSITSSYTVNLPSAPVQVFSFVLGSLDQYNSVQLFFANSTSLILTGADIIGQPVVFNSQGNSVADVSGRVTYDMGGQSGITSVKFSSTFAAFEIDDLATAVPEPAAWGMMIMGFGLIGSQLRSRRTRKTALAAA